MAAGALVAAATALWTGAAGAAAPDDGTEPVFQTVLMELDTPWLLHPQRHHAVPTRRHPGWEPMPDEAVRVTHTVLPQVPDPGSDRTEAVTCQAQVSDRGVDVEDCPDSWRQLTRAAVREWRFEPALVDDRRRLKVGITYPPPAEGVSPVVSLERSLVGDETLLPPEVTVVSDPLWVVRKAVPAMPENPEPLARCIATLTVNAKGKVDAVAVEGCPERYHGNVEKAAMKNVFGIPETTPTPPVNTKITYTFKKTGS